MKILLVSMNSIHFRRWASQLEDTSHEVYWFDALGAEGYISGLPWVHQKTDWRLRIKKGHYTLKKIPGFNKINERNIEQAFEAYLKEIQPDVVHSFALHLSVTPLLQVMKSLPKLKWTASTWGSDVYSHDKLGITDHQFRDSLKRLDYVITDCLRDERIIKDNGFNGKHLGVFPGNGGIDFIIPVEELIKCGDRKQIFIKAYDDDIGRGDVIIKSVLNIPKPVLQHYKLIFVGVSNRGANAIKSIPKDISVEVFARNKPINNSKLLLLLSESYIYIGNSLSDGIPNMLFEAMGNGAFPIQSNPGSVTQEIIENNKNGILIHNPLSAEEITTHITSALRDKMMIENSFHQNIEKIRSRCNRLDLKRQIEEVYGQMV